MTRLSRRAATIALTVFALVGAAAAKTATPAEAFVAQVLSEANPVFARKAEADRRAGIDALVGKYVDLDRTGMFVLGQYAKAMTPAQKAEYTPLFRRYASRIYQNTLANYRGEKLEVTGSVQRSERDTIVNSRVVNPSSGSQYARSVIMWRVYAAPDGTLKIFDAGADNVWLAIEQQSQFKSVIANNGGGARGVDALIADLKRRLAE